MFHVHKAEYSERPFYNPLLNTLNYLKVFVSLVLIDFFHKVLLMKTILSQTWYDVGNQINSVQFSFSSIFFLLI